MNKIALFTLAVGKDSTYINAVQRYCFYNRTSLMQNVDIDYYLLTDRKNTTKKFIHIPCTTSVWPYAALLKNNYITDYLNTHNKWDKYTHVFFIDADFGIADTYDFLQHEFIFLSPYWNSKIAGGFYGGKTEWFKLLCLSFYEEIKYIYENKLPVPLNLDEFYLEIFYNQNDENIHLIQMKKGINTYAFYDNENIEEIIREQGGKLFLHPYKSKGRANKTIVWDSYNEKQECTVNLDDKYIFNNLTYEFGRLLNLGEAKYRILWSKYPEKREILDISTCKIYRQNSMLDIVYLPPVISIVMPVYNVTLKFLKESIDSILNQTYKDFELIIINDGSTEQEGIDWLRTCSDSRLRLINNSHDFIETLNIGIGEAKGKYIVRMDADDIMLPTRLQQQYEFMEEHIDVDICGSWMELFGAGSGSVRNPINHEQIIASLLLFNPISHPSVIIRKESLSRKGIKGYSFGYSYAEDYKLWVDMVMKGCYFANIPEVLLKYRVSDKQVTTLYNEEMSRSSVKIQHQYLEWVMQYIVEQRDEMESIFNTLIDAVNNEIVNSKHLVNFVYSVFLDLLEVDDND